MLKLNDIQYFSPSDKPFNLTDGAWTVKWWQWIWSIPDAINPLNDQTGKNASINQPEKDVWFLAGTWATEKLLNVPNREVTIPADSSDSFSCYKL